MSTPPTGDSRFGPADPAQPGVGPSGFLAAPPRADANPPVKLGAPRWLVLTALGVVGALVLLGVAIYQVQAQRTRADKAVFEATTLTVPESVLGLVRGVGPGVQNVETRANLALAEGGAVDPVSAGYLDADGSSVAFIAAGKRVTRSDELADTATTTADRFSSGLAAAGQPVPVSLTDTQPGTRGGVMRCGVTSVATLAATYCVAVDEGAVVQVVVATDDLAAAADTARGLREAVVQRS